MGVYKSRYSSKDINDVLTKNFNIQKQFVKTKDTGYNTEANKISINRLTVKTPYNVRAVSLLYRHTFYIGSIIYSIITHYPTQYKTPYDAIYDYNDQILTMYNNEKIFSTQAAATGMNFWTVNSSGSIITHSVYKSDTFTSYRIDEFRG